MCFESSIDVVQLFRGFGVTYDTDQGAAPSNTTSSLKVASTRGQYFRFPSSSIKIRCEQHLHCVYNGWFFRVPGITKMKLHGCRHCGARFELYTALEEHVRTHANACSKCNRVFTQPDRLLAHTCKVGDYLCESCQHTFSTQKQLDRHKRETSCHHSLPPEPKRRRVTPSPPPFEEDPVEQPPPQQDSNLQDVITENWSSIRSHVTRGPVQSRYNYRLTSLDTRSLELRHIFEEQTTAFKINISYGFILRNKQTGRYRLYHSSCNCCGRYLDEPSLITNAETFEKFLERIKEPDLLNWAVSQRPNSDWICEMVTNATFFVNKILQHPIGCVGIVLPPHIKQVHHRFGDRR